MNAHSLSLRPGPLLRLLVVSVMSLMANEVFSQCPVPSFVAPASACINGKFALQNTTTGSARLEWDFCPGDLLQTPAVTPMGVLSTLSSVEDLKLVNDNGQWFGFALGRQNNTITRMGFGTDVSNTNPSIVPLGNPGNLLSAPTAIELVKEGSKWLGVVLNTGDNKLVALDFGSSLSNDSPAATAMYSSIGSTNSSMTVIQPGGGVGIALVCDFNTSDVKAVRFGQGFTNPATGVTSVPLSGSTNPIDLHAVERCGNWYVYVVGYGAKEVTRLDYLQDFVSVPAQTTFGSGSFPANPYRIWAGREGSDYHLLFSLEEGTLLRADLGADPLNTLPAFTALGKFGVLANTWSLDVAHQNGRWFAFTVNGASKQSYQVSFPEICTATLSYSTASDPGILSYSSSGNHTIALTAVDANEHSAVTAAVVNVNALTAPAIAIGVDAGRCDTHVNAFTGVSADPIALFDWDFGDGLTAAIQNPTHQYGTAGPYDVDLTVTGTNGCLNRAQQHLIIFNEPVANFDLPSISPFCTNQQYSFVNTTQSDADSQPSWTWSIDGTVQSSNEDLSVAFASTAPKVIKLQASIPGCMTEKTSTINTINQGPLTDFSFSDACAGTSVQFTNETSGQVTTYSWDFGDGNSSGQTNAQNIFSQPGNYDVVLTASNLAGCNNTASKSVTIYSTPQTDFSLDLPPFSCSGSPSQFNDATPNPTDSNLASWAWTFGDGANGTSTQRNPAYTYALAGPYTVGLTVTTNFGCSASVQKGIAISQSPAASFDNTPACVNSGTQFTDTSTGSIKSWQWTIDNSSYTLKNPLQIFTASGSYTATLAVTDNNNCIGQATRMISVPVAQAPNFTAQNTCATQPTIFTDVTPVGPDPIVSNEWDFAGQGSGAGSPAQFEFPSTGSFSVTMEAHAQSGCVYPVTKAISISSPPVADFTPSTDAGAVPLTVQFTNGSGNADHYVWRFGDGNNTTSTLPSPTFTFDELGEYLVDLDAINTLGCVDTHSEIIRVVVPRVDARLTDLQFVRDPATHEGQVLFSINNAGNVPLINPTVRLEVSGHAILSEKLTLTILPGGSESRLLNYSLLTDGQEYLCLTVEADQDAFPYDNRQCAGVTGETVVLAPYPNPADGELHVDWIAVAPGDAQFIAYSSTGSKVFEQSVEATAAGLNQVRIDVSSWSPGVYLIVFNYDGRKETFRFAVQ